jgi:putative holliday junction resolvase
VTPLRVLALDYGTARIGVAVSDELGLLAHPRPIVPGSPPERAYRLIAALAREEQIGLVLLGLPQNMDGTEGRSAQRVRKFAAQLGQRLTCPIEFVDERRSTVLASLLLRETGHRAAHQKPRIDSASAAVFLQAYLDQKGRTP